MKIGVAGLGFMGSTHLEAYQQVKGFELAAVSSSDPQKRSGDLSTVSGNLSRGGGTYDFSTVARYKTADALIADPGVEAVDLCTPTHLHAPLTLKALKAGKHVLVEKPMGLTAEECDAMVAAAREAGRVLMVAQVIRFFPEYATARQLALSGELGPIRAAVFRRKCAAPKWGRWLKDPEHSGGGVMDLLVHDLDFCQYLFGRPRSIRAIGYEDLEGGIDFVDAQLDYGGDVSVIVTGGWHHAESYPFSMEFTIVCDGGTLDFSSEKTGLRLHRSDGKQIDVAIPETDGFVNELQAFVDACQAGRPPDICRPEDSAETIRMVLAMKRSRAAHGEPAALE